MSGNRIFKGERFSELQKILEMEKYSFKSVADYFGVDHTSVRNQAKHLGYKFGKHTYIDKHCLDCDVKISINALRCKRHASLYSLNLIKSREETERYERGERINQGHSYSWYVANERKRHKSETLEEIIRRKLKRQAL